MKTTPSALITGSGTGIGRGIALTLAQAGYDIAIHYNSSRDTALSACAEIEAMGRQAVAIQADLSQHDGVCRLFEQYSQAYDRLDIFVNNSGITKGSRLLEMSEALFDQICQINWKGAYFAVQQAARLMTRWQQNGSIVIITSNQQEIVYQGTSAYGSMKAALRKFARHAALELAPDIRVNVIAPGFTDTGSPRMGEKEPTYEVIPMRRWCTPEEIGQAVLFLSSPHARSITGACIMMDGGASLKPMPIPRRKLLNSTDTASQTTPTQTGGDNR
jgi:NAD(P)-dependent dehydrogenase (short-subunit alcohol dehydrogenase family)